MSEQRQYSEDGQWWWDAEAGEWKAVEGGDAGGGGDASGGGGGEGGDAEGQGGAPVNADEVASMMDAAEQEASEA